MTDKIVGLINWHKGVMESLHSRQLWSAVVTVVALLVYYFTGVKLNQDVILGFIFTMISLIVGSSVSQAGHALAQARLASLLPNAKVQSPPPVSDENLH
jgi:hypothetical protein